MAAFRAAVGRRLQSRAYVALAVLLITLVSCAWLPFLHFEGRIDVMLPDRSELRDVFAFLREIQVADKVLATFSMRDASADPDALIAAADGYVAGLDPALAKPLRIGQSRELAQDFARLARQIPDYLEEADRARFRQEASEDGIRGALERLRHRMHQPEGLFAAAAARADPLDWTGQTAKKVLSALTSFGYRAVPVGQHLMDPERRHLLLVMQTPVTMTDAAGVRRLLAHLASRAAALPPGVEARLVCGHLHTAGNEAVIRRDIRITGIAVTALFVLLFLGVYRDWRAMTIVLIPFLASVPAMALAAAVFRPFSLMVVGFGSVIAGIAVDYGIHVYVTARGAERARNLRRIRRPVTLSALTTLCVFVVFCFSSLPAYRQLGLFASFAIVIALAYAFWVLPPFIRGGAASTASQPVEPLASGFTRSRASSWGITALAGALLVAGIWLASRLRLDTELSRLDGTPRATLEEEKRAMAIWGGGETLSAILCVEAPDTAAALRLNDRVYTALLAEGLAAAEIGSLSPIVPSDETRRLRRQAWAACWTDETARLFRERLEREAAALDFSEAAFASFWELFDRWRLEPADHAVEPIGFLAPLVDRFVHTQKGGSRVITFVPDEPRCLAIAERLRQEIPSLRVISRNAFSQSLSATLSHEILRLSLLAAALIALVTVVVIGRPGMALLAALPALAGMLWSGAVLVLLGLPMSVSSLIAGIIVLGLDIDYGICMVYAHRRGMRRDVFRAVTLSALTTVLGAGVLLLARHPALYSIGITLVSGVSVGYLFAWLLLPAMQTLWPRLNPVEEEP